jgi:hypothetical protein
MRALSRWTAAFVVIGLALRVWNYAAASSLWLDEILLSRNVLARGAWQLLTEPLQLDQVAPPGFLLVEKLAVASLGASELTLRLFPFLCGVAGLILFRAVAEEGLQGIAVPIAVALFATSVPLIRFAAEVKQYECDATAAVALLLLALRLRRPDVSRAFRIGAGLAGLALVWFSQASVLMLCGLGIAFALFWLHERDRSSLETLRITVPLWAVACALATAVGMRSMAPATRTFMYEFWRAGFPPGPLGWDTPGWAWQAALSVFTDRTLLRYPWPELAVGISALGMAALARRHREAAVFLALPLLVAIAAALARQYPLQGRLMFYLMPGLLLAIANGMAWLCANAGRLHVALRPVVLLALAIPPALSFARMPPPYDIEHSRTVLSYVAARRQSGDAIHVMPLQRISALFYGPRVGLLPDHWVTGVCNRDDTRAYIRDVDRYRGVKRLWLISAAAVRYGAARDAIRGYLGAIGVRRDSLSLPSLLWDEISVDLYDLSDLRRLGVASAETFEVAPMPSARPGCRPWIRPSPLDGY